MATRASFGRTFEVHGRTTLHKPGSSRGVGSLAISEAAFVRCGTVVSAVACKGGRRSAPGAAACEVGESPQICWSGEQGSDAPRGRMVQQRGTAGAAAATNEGSSDANGNCSSNPSGTAPGITRADQVTGPVGRVGPRVSLHGCDRPIG